MAAPKIKIYKLPAGYSQDGDNDVVAVTNDELVPIADKPLSPDDWYTLTGAVQSEDETLTPVDYSFGLVTAELTGGGQEYQNSEFSHVDILIPNQLSGAYPQLFTGSMQEVDKDDYVATPSGVRFVSTPYPTGYYLKYWRQGSTPATVFAADYSNQYDGLNPSFMEVVSIDGTVSARSSYTIDATYGFFTVPSASAVIATYWHEEDEAAVFLSEHENWLPPNSESSGGGHLYMGPDVFKGVYDYPADDSEDALGNPIPQGEIPQFVDPAGYQIDFRKGCVTFPAAFSQTTYPVHASYAHMVGVSNVTGQTLSPVASPSGQYDYRATSDAINPNSIGSMWVGRDDSFTPRNIYIDGELKPIAITVSPYDTPTVKTEA